MTEIERMINDYSISYNKRSYLIREDVRQEIATDGRMTDYRKGLKQGIKALDDELAVLDMKLGYNL